MKKFFLILLIILFFSTVGFSFDVLNSNNLEQTYFSIANSEVSIETTQNLTNFSVIYLLNSNIQTNTFDLNTCSNKYCGNFILSDLIFFGNGSFSSSTEFEIIVGTETKKVFLDVEKPKLLVKNITINKDSKKLEIKYNYSDNSNSLLSVDLYEKEGSNLNFIGSLLNKNEIEINITNSGNNILVLKAIDEAGNLEEIEEIVYIGDIFKPIIEKISVIKDLTNTKLEFKITDDNLSKYEISQDGVTISEDIFGSVFEKTLNIPFSSGNIQFEVLDEEENKITQTISLNSLFKNVYRNKFSKKKEFEFTSNAQKCFLTKLDTSYKNNEFTKSGDEFSIDLDITTSKEYTLEFYCELNNFKEYFSTNFYYDTNPPTSSEVSIEKNERGYLELSWLKAEDDESSVTYRLFRNGKEIYQGSKLKYTDSDVEYPETYSYYLEVFDEANNIVTTSSISETPKKLLITLKTNIIDKTTLENNNYNLKLSSDIGSDISIIVKNNEVITQNQDYLNIEVEDISYDINLKEGTNQIIIKIEDVEGNIKEETFYLNYVPKVLNNPEPINTITEEVKQEPIVEEILPGEEKNAIWWIWYFLILVIILMLFIVVYINHHHIKRHISKIKPKQRKAKLHKGHNYMPSRQNDSVLHKSLVGIKKQREQRQKEFELNLKKKEIKRELTEFEKSKLKDLSIEKRNLDIPSKNNINKKDFIREKTLDEELEEIKDPQDKKSWNFRNFFVGNKKNLVPKDTFSEYILKKRSEKSWGSTKDYLMSTKLEKEKKIQEKIMEKQSEENKILQEKMQKENEKQLLQEKKIKEEEEKLKHETNRREARSSLDDYLTKRRKKNKIFLLAEHFVERDILRRKRK